MLRWWPLLGFAATLLLGGAVGTGSTRLDDRFAAAVAPIDPGIGRGLLLFTGPWVILPVLLTSLGVAVHRRRWTLAVAVVATPYLTTLVTMALKNVYQRRNGPYLEYPSGHTALLVTVVGMMAVVSGWRIGVVVVAAAVALAGMAGLVLCGYHYLTDIVGAALLATSAVCLAARLCAGRAPRWPARTLTAVLCCVGVSGASAAPGWAVPGVSPEQSAAGLVEVHTAVPDALVDLRYGSADNFVGTPLYPAGARCLVHRDLAPPLAAAAQTLADRGYRLVFWDCYRPHSVQVRMFEAFPDPAFVARPGDHSASHETGRSVDVTLAPLRCPAGGEPCAVDMGTDFDDFSSRAAAWTTDDIDAAAVAHRAVLREAMTDAGFAVYSAEWWHFDGPGAKMPRPVVDVPVT